MTSKTKIDHAMKLMDSDPQLAADFDAVRASDYPGKDRRQAATIALAALEAKKNAGLAAERSKALKHLAMVAKDKFKSFVTMGRPERPDRPQAALSARDLLSLTDAQAKAMLEKAAFALSGREVRLEIKRALLAASPTEKCKLFSRYEQAITAFSSESIS